MTQRSQEPNDGAPKAVRYQIVERLGEGGMGVVYKAIDLESNLPIALKTLTTVNPERILRLKAEFRSLRDIRHPNLVRLGELVEEDGSWFFTMELVEGVSFREYVHGQTRPLDPASWSRTVKESEATKIRKPARMRRGAVDSSDDAVETIVDTPTARPDGQEMQETTVAELTAWQGETVTLDQRPDTSSTPPPSPPVVRELGRPTFVEERLRAVLRELATGLAVLHHAGCIHRDIKPSNIMIDGDGRAVLLDFGVAAPALKIASEQKRQFVGTVPYMAPEQAMGEALTPAADWYAVGAMLYEALTGMLPYGRGKPEELLVRKFAFTPVRPSELVADLPEDLVELCMKLLAQRPNDRPSEDEILRAVGAEGVTEWLAFSPLQAVERDLFVGREAELGRLGRALAKSRLRSAAAVLIMGESGVGKSALVTEFLSRAAKQGPAMVSLAGRCHERERVPYNAFDGVVDDLAHLLSGLGAKKTEKLLPSRLKGLLTIYPALRAVPLLALAAEAEPGAEIDPRVEAFASLRKILRRLARRRPVVVILDDLQWADGDSRALLRELTAEPGAPAILLLAASRPVEGGLPPALEDFAIKPEVIELGGLNAKEAEKLAVRFLAELPGSFDVDVTEVAAEAGGHPLFITELIRAAAITGERASRLDEALWRRASALEPKVRDVLAMVSIAGAGASHRAIASACGIDAIEYESCLERLLEHGFVCISGARISDRVELFHDRIRESVWRHIGAERRKALHLALAETLEAFGAAPEELFVHFNEGGALEQAAWYAEVAAGRAVAALAFDRAAELYRFAVEQARSKDARLALLIALGGALVDAGRVYDSAIAYREAAGLASEPAQVRALERKAAGQLIKGGYVEEGLEAARTVLRSVGLKLPSNNLMTITRLMSAQLKLSRHPLTWKHSDRVDADLLEAIDACWETGAGFSMIDLPLGSYFSALGSLLSLRSADPFRISRALSQSTIGAASMAEHDRVARYMAALEQAAQQDGTPLAQYYVQQAKAVVAFGLRQDFRTTYEGALEAEKRWKSIGRGRGWEADQVSHFLCASLNFIGPLPELVERVRERIRDAQRRGNLYQEVTFRVRFIWEHLMADAPDEAERDIDDALASWVPESKVFGNQRLWASLSRSRAILYRGDVAARRDELLRDFKKLKRTLVSRVPLLKLEWPLTLANVWVALGLDAKRRSDRQELVRCIHEANRYGRVIASVPLPMGEALPHLIWAGVECLNDDIEGALEHITAIRAPFAERSMSPYLACFDRMVGLTVGGSRGEELLSRSNRWFADNEIRNPDRVCRLLVASWPGVS